MKKKGLKMTRENVVEIAFLLSFVLVWSSLEVVNGEISHKFRRDDFPPQFVFGAGTSAYQVEGAVAEDGRTPSIWDTYTHAGKMPDNSTGDVTADGYHKYKEDVKLMSDTGLEAYRFSISWSRLIPKGRGTVNPKGLEYYNNLINELLKYGIQPHVTLYHLDLPQVLEDEYGGWLSPRIVDDFTAFADVCFSEFGDRVSHWTTVVQPNIIGQACYDFGLWPPSRCSYPFGSDCTSGDSTTEPYIVVHNILLSHASVVALYRTKYKDTQNGWIGINVWGGWYIPLTNATADVEATKRAQDFIIGWILNPLVYGDYPDIMKKNAGARIPTFTASESEKVKGSFDFLGLNYYSSAYVGDHSENLDIDARDYLKDMCIIQAASKNDTPTTGQIVPTHITSYPPGLKKLLLYIKQAYANPPIYVQENGYGIGDRDGLNDTARVDYLNDHIESVLDAIRNGTDVRGYFVWSFIDVFEFLAGYTSGCGLHYVDFADEEHRRQPRLSAHWYAKLLRKTETNMKGNIFELNTTSHFEE